MEELSPSSGRDTKNVCGVFVLGPDMVLVYEVACAVYCLLLVVIGTFGVCVRL